jgi:DNA replication protein DnaC
LSSRECQARPSVGRRRPLIDRLGHHAEVVVIEGKNYRMNGKEKEEDLKAEKK